MWYSQKGLGVLQEAWNNVTRWIQRDIIVPLGSAISINTWVCLKIVGRRHTLWWTNIAIENGHL